jgi:hypothetical protein
LTLSGGSDTFVDIEIGNFTPMQKTFKTSVRVIIILLVAFFVAVHVHAQSASVNISQTITSSSSSTVVYSCPLISSMMLKKGGPNDSAEVTKLQTFLKNSEGLNVTVNGMFDDATEAAVIAFQNKYAESILYPWGGSKASGVVYITTLKKINELACKQPLTLNSSEAGTISAFRTRIVAETNPNDTQVSVSSSPSASVMNSSVTPTSSISATPTPESTANTATSQDALTARFWNFLVDLFR